MTTRLPAESRFDFNREGFRNEYPYKRRRGRPEGRRSARVVRSGGAVISASCHCGRVRLEIDAPLSEVTECNCSLCRRYGVLWAYYPPDRVRMSPPDPPTDVYMWDGRSIEFHRCRNCGCVSHWVAANRKKNRMGVNARLMDPEILAGAHVRHRDGDGTNRYTD